MREAERIPCGGRRCWARGALVLIVLVTAFFRPGDTTWINDEPKLLRMAMLCNAGQFADLGVHVPGTPATLGVFGLMGTRGARYGPAPVWLYQIFLAITHDPVVMVVMRALICGAGVAVALDWLLGTMGWNPWLAVVTMLSPWLWHYSRELWDNSFCIPLSAILIAGYADYLKTRRLWPLCIAGVAAGLLPLTHFMSVALLAPVGVHLVFRPANRWRPIFVFAIVVLAVEVPAWPYWKWITQNYLANLDPERSPIAGFGYPFLGGHHLTATGLGNLLGERWQFALPGVWPYVVLAAEYFSAIAFVAVWIGIIRGSRQARRVIRRMNPSLEDHLTMIAMGVLLCQILLDGVQRVYDGPQYFNATWIAYAIFAYRTVGLLSPRWQKVVLWAQGAALGTVLVSVMALVAFNGGMKTWGWGTNLGLQVSAVREIGNTPLAGGDAQHQPFGQWQTFPWEYDTLKGMMIDPSAPGRGDAVASVKYREQWAWDAHIAVEFAPR
jgi:hypothetical protein